VLLLLRAVPSASAREAKEGEQEASEDITLMLIGKEEGLLWLDVERDRQGRRTEVRIPNALKQHFEAS
jgi:hypothetical protein